MKADRGLLGHFALLGLIGTVAIFAVYGAVPSARVPLVEEDRVLEYASVAIYLAAAVIGVVLIASPLRRHLPALSWALPPLAIVAALDEIDWGRRILDLDMPESHGVQVDTSQRVVKLALVVLEDELGWVFYVGLGVLAAGLVVAAYRSRDRLVDAARRFWASESGKFVVIWLALGATASIPDRLHDLTFHMLLFEETLELYSALALLFATLALVPAERAERVA